MYLYSKEGYWIACERGIAQYIDCATPGMEDLYNCELVPFTNSARMWGNSFSGGSVEGLVTNLTPPANQANLHTYIKW